MMKTRNLILLNSLTNQIHKKEKKIIMISMKPTEKKIRIKIEPSIHMKDAHYALIFSEDSNYIKGEITWDGVITTPENLDDVVK